MDSPAEAAQRAIVSFRRLGPVTPEIHQFGLLFEPFGADAGGDPGPMYASWEFQTLARLMIAGPPRRVFHWGAFASVGKMPFLNGSGVLRLALDHYLGADIEALPVNDDAKGRPFPAEVYALGLTRSEGAALMVSSFSPHPAPGARMVTVTAPKAWTQGRLRFVRYAASDNVFATIKRDLAADGNLRADFATCALCLGQPVLMARDADKARQMIGRNWPRYQIQMHNQLKWTEGSPEIAIKNGSLTVKLEANELIIAEPSR